MRFCSATLCVPPIQDQDGDLVVDKLRRGLSLGSIYSVTGRALWDIEGGFYSAVYLGSIDFLHITCLTAGYWISGKFLL